MGGGKGRGLGRVRLFVSNRRLGRVGSTFRLVGSKKSDPWTTLNCALLLCVFNNCVVFHFFQVNQGSNCGK